MAELKPCPFCGWKARLKHGSYNLFGAYGTPNEDRKWYGVFCYECGVSQPKRTYDTKEKAIEAWNKRAESEELKFTRKFIHEHGLDFALASAWNRRAKDEPL